MKSIFLKEVKQGFVCQRQHPSEKITEDDLKPLPDLIQNYLRKTGVVGKEKVLNLKISFSGKIRSKPTDGWMNLTAKQYSFFDKPTRIFFLKAWKMGIPAIGLHVFKNGKASMVVKMLGLFKIVDVRGKEMDQAETVTHFNDMCLMAPATLIDKNIRWKTLDSRSVRAFYKPGEYEISADLFFNKNAELTNFISNDRYDLSDKNNPRNVPFSTPVAEYRDFNGLHLPYKAKAVYDLPEGEFCYGEFVIEFIEYNCNR